MSGSDYRKINVIKRMTDEDWTADLFTSYMNAAMTILGEHRSFKNKTFHSIEQLEGRIRASLGGMRCHAFREWGDYRFGSFGLFAQAGDRQGRGEIWKTKAPEGVLRAVASRYEAVSTSFHPMMGALTDTA
jgi:hypothetical protein